jgi:capsular exopolysaccharide synthesis family protein
VILVDGDLRRPTVASSLGLIEGAGLTDVLIGRADLDDVLQPHASVAHLNVLAAGGVPPNPSELLGSQAMRKLLQTLSERGMVIIDAPPLLPVTDGAVLTAVSDGAFVVVSTGRTLDSELASSLDYLEAVSGQALGIILNGVPSKDVYSSYYQYDAAGRGKKGRRKARDGKATPPVVVDAVNRDAVKPVPVSTDAIARDQQQVSS